MHKKIRLAYLVSHPIQYQAPLLKKISQDENIDLVVLYRSDLSVKEYRDEEFGVKVHWDLNLLDGYEYRFIPMLWRSYRIGFFSPVNRGILDLLKKEQIDILWVHGWGSLTNILAIIWAIYLNIPILMRGESSLHTEKYFWPRAKIKKMFLNILFKNISAFLAIGSANKEFYLNYGIDQRKIFMMPYAVDNQRLKMAINLSLDPVNIKSDLIIDCDRKVLLFVGKFTERKRAKDLMDAYICLSRVEHNFKLPSLIFVGDGDCRKELEVLKELHGLNQVHIVGFKNQTELPHYFNLADIFIMPSMSEPWGLVLNEAMCAGCAVIASDQVGAAFDLVRNDENGYIYPAGDVNELAKVLIQLLSNECEITRMGNRSLEIIAEWSYRENVIGLHKALSFLGK